MAEALSGVDASISAPVDVRQVTITSRPGAIVHDWQQRVEDLVAGLRARTPLDELDGLERTIAGALVLPVEQRWLKLETVRITFDQRAKERRVEAALSIFQKQRRELIAERIHQQVNVCQARLDELASPRIEALQSELDAFSERIASADLDEADEDRLEDMNRRVLQEQARLRLLNDAVAQLQRMGYAQVQVMQTLSASDIASAFLEDPDDPERLALVQVSAQHGLMTAEVVRRTSSNGSSSQRQADFSAQVRLCRAMASAESALAGRWGLQVRSDKPPGAVVQQTKVPLPQRKVRVRRPAALRARQVGG
jgi:hypothetical protein